MSTAVLDNDTRVVLENKTNNGSGDHDKFSHYVRKDQILPSAMTGDPVVAFCGKVWTPSSDPQKYPVCPECQDILDKLFPESQ